MKDEFKRKSGKGIGPGGYKCHCCGPSPKDRPSHRRRVRARLAEDLRGELSEPVDLSKVAEALKRYDDLDDELTAKMSEWSISQCYRVMLRIDAQGVEVAEAFYEATKDRNSRNNAMLVRPGNRHAHSPSWLRRTLQQTSPDLYNGIKNGNDGD